MKSEETITFSEISLTWNKEFNNVNHILLKTTSNRKSYWEDRVNYNIQTYCIMKVFHWGFFSKCDQISRKLRIWSLLLKKSLIINFNICACELRVSCVWAAWLIYKQSEKKGFILSNLVLIRFFLNCTYIPVDTGRKLNVHKTFRRRPWRLLNVLCTFNLRSVSTGMGEGSVKNNFTLFELLSITFSMLIFFLFLTIWRQKLHEPLFTPPSPSTILLKFIRSFYPPPFLHPPSYCYCMALCDSSLISILHGSTYFLSMKGNILQIENRLFNCQKYILVPNQTIVFRSVLHIVRVKRFRIPGLARKVT